MEKNQRLLFELGHYLFSIATTNKSEHLKTYEKIKAILEYFNILDDDILKSLIIKSVNHYFKYTYFSLNMKIQGKLNVVCSYEDINFFTLASLADIGVGKSLSKDEGWNLVKAQIKDLLKKMNIDKNLEKEFLKVDSHKEMNDWIGKLYNYIENGDDKNSHIGKNHLFVLMPMDDSNSENEDILNTIKEVSKKLSIETKRIDEDEKNERITDRIVENIKRAKYIIAVLNSNKPNVYWEAGYAHAINKTPIYLAKEGNDIHFNLKDYPIIFYKNYTELKRKLHKRLNSVIKIILN